jgi:hypothetical protein
MSYANQGIAPVKPSHVRTPHDQLPLPGGKRLRDLRPAELSAYLVKLGIEGASHSQGHARNAEAYAAQLSKVRAEGAERAQTEWLAEQESA